MWGKRRFSWLVACSVFLTLVSFGGFADTAWADGSDKSGVRPQVINLPSGAGSVQGLGESFQPLLNTGTASYQIALEMPPGTNDFAPDLTLSYDGGQSNGFFGLGWRLDLPAIQRQTDKGLPRYTADDLLLHSSGEELVPLGDNLYRFKVEGAFTRFRRLAVGWEATERDGVRWLLGITANGQQSNPLGSFSWLPQRAIDTNGNEIRFFYVHDNGQLYLSEIRYNVDREALLGQEAPDRYVSIRFIYETRPDPRSDYRSRSLIRTNWRTKTIIMSALGQRVRHYEFSYADGDGVSLLTEVRMVGRDLARSEADPTTGMPPLRFTYTRVDPSRAHAVSMVAPPPVGLGNPNVELVDINGDALPDLVDTKAPYGGHRFYLNRGNGRWATEPFTPAQSPNARLETVGVQLADMDGDSLADLLIKAGATSNAPFYFYPNRGGNAWDWTHPVYFRANPPFTYEDPNVELVDLDQDRRIDLIRTTASATYIYLNRTDRWTSDLEVRAPLAYGATLLLDDPRVQLADMNGDRMQDMVFVRDGQVVYFPTKGLGEFDQVVKMAHSPSFFGNPAGALLADIDGDGLSDLLRVSGFAVSVWINRAAMGYGPEIRLEKTPEYIADKTQLRLADMNGDGATDLLYATFPAATAQRYRYLDFTGGAPPYLLESIDNGLGQVTHLTYRTSTDYYVDDWDAEQPWSLRSPAPVTVVSRRAVTDKLSGQQYVTDYTYHNAYYDSQEKTFRGFALVEEIERGEADAPTAVRRIIFDTGAEDESRKGMTLQEDLLAEGGTCGMDDPVAAAATATSDHTAVAPTGCYTRMLNRVATRTVLTGVTGITVTFSVVEQSDTLIYENSRSPRRLQQRYVYDNYGNVTAAYDYGEVALDGANPSLGNDERLEYTDYINNLTIWLLGIPKETRQTDLAGNFVSAARFYYDGPPFIGLPLGQATAGNLTRSEANSGPHGGDRWLPDSRLQYDRYGNVTALLDPNGRLDGSGNPTADGHWNEVLYDPDFHLYPVQETVHLEQGRTLTAKAEYDLGFGVVTRAWDFNGQVTTYHYDGLARLVAIVQPGDTVDLPTASYRYYLADPLSTVTTALREQSGTENVFRSVSYVDGLGRTVQSRAEAENGQVAVVDAVTFNRRGDVREAYLPYYAATFDYAPPLPTQPKIVTDYDPLGRAIANLNPDGTTARTVYLPLSQQLFDEEDANPQSPHANTPIQYTFDGLERLIAVQEQNGAAIYTTRYGYDLLDNLTVITDSEGNVKTQRFDALGRKLQANDPNRGVDLYTYDDAGNLLTTVDAKGQETRYRYDGANRPLTVNFVQRIDDNTPDIVYHYDDDLAPGYGDATNTLGRTTWVEDESGWEVNSYDARGNLSAVMKRINPLRAQEAPAPSLGEEPMAGRQENGSLSNLGRAGEGLNGGGLDFILRMEYDALDRLTLLTYPDGKQLEQRYNAQNLLEAIPGYVDNLAYLASGQPSHTTYADGVTTHYDYDSRLRLTGLKSLRSDGVALQDWRYTLDGVGNFLGIDDLRADRTTADDDTRTFVYDDLYRLTQARYTATADQINYAYSPMGNVTRKTSTIAKVNLGEMSYGQNAGPYALTGVQGGTWRYDATGNLIARPAAGRNFTYGWDFRDRLTTIEGDDGLRQIHLFDAANRRMIKQVQMITETVTTLYPHKLVEVRGNQLIKYIFAGDERVAEVRTPFAAVNLIRGLAGTFPERSLGSIDQKQAKPVNPTNSEPQIIFYHGDYLGSATVLTDEQGNVVERVSYLPFGEERTHSGGSAVTHRYTGQEQDGEAGLYYYGARFYEPVVGRFVSVDPLYATVPEHHKTEPRQSNLYAYTLDNPVKLIDPTGLGPGRKINLSNVPASSFASPANVQKTAPLPWKNKRGNSKKHGGPTSQKVKYYTNVNHSNLGQGTPTKSKDTKAVNAAPVPVEFKYRILVYDSTGNLKEHKNYKNIANDTNKPKYDAGHMIGKQLGGKADNTNLEPQSAEINRGNYLNGNPTRNLWRAHEDEVKGFLLQTVPNTYGPAGTNNPGGRVIIEVTAYFQ